jgi:hypothetical protein
MRRPTLGLALCVGLAASACATMPPADRAQQGAAKEQVAGASACADWRWIAITAAGTSQCPKPPKGWTMERLFVADDEANLQGGEREREGYGSPAAPPSAAADEHGLRTA